MIDDREIAALDAADPLASRRDLFDLPDGTIYLDGNSLGALPKGVAQSIAHVVEQEWGRTLIDSWNAGWFYLPMLVGDQIAPLVGARSGEVAVGDSTSVNLFKCLAAALSLRPNRRVIVAEKDNFPTDNYIIQGLTKLIGNYEINYAEDDRPVESLIDERVAAVLLTHVNYRTAQMHDLTAITAAAHAKGALTIWDLSHSVGAVPLDMTSSNVDFAVGCTYKYLNGGPGAPAFVYAPGRLLKQAQQPLSGWMGHRNPFDFSLEYEPADAARRFVCGTPQILSLAALSASLRVWNGVDMHEVRAKSLRLTDLFIELIESECGRFGLKIITPHDRRWRGSHVSVTCGHGYPVMRALIERRIIGDFRPPNLMRFGFTPLYTRYRDVSDAVAEIRSILESGVWRAERFSIRGDVT